MRRMTEAEIAQCNDAALRIATAMRDELQRQPLHIDQMQSALAIATTLVVSYGSMQRYLETLAACADAKERVRAIDANEVPDVH
jgi:hypothetical protein